MIDITFNLRKIKNYSIRQKSTISLACPKQDTDSYHILYTQ